MHTVEWARNKNAPVRQGELSTLTRLNGGVVLGEIQQRQRPSAASSFRFGSGLRNRVMIVVVVFVRFLHFDGNHSLLLFEILDPFESPSFRLFLRRLRRAPSFFPPSFLMWDPAHQREIMDCHVAEIDSGVHLLRGASGGGGRGGQR